MRAEPTFGARIASSSACAGNWARSYTVLARPPYHMMSSCVRSRDLGKRSIRAFRATQSTDFGTSGTISSITGKRFCERRMRTFMPSPAVQLKRSLGRVLVGSPMSTLANMRCS